MSIHSHRKPPGNPQLTTVWTDRLIHQTAIANPMASPQILAARLPTTNSINKLQPTSIKELVEKIKKVWGLHIMPGYCETLIDSMPFWLLAAGTPQNISECLCDFST
jgi:hypothetical protein